MEERIMMTKKEYTAPILEVVKVDNAQLLSGSVTLDQAEGLYNGEFHSPEFDSDLELDFE